MAIDFSTAREMMVDCQIRTADVTQLDLLDAFLEVPREAFVPVAQKPLAYIDDHLAISDDRRMMAPAALAKLLQAARIDADDVVLDIGCGLGYSTAVISRICSSVLAVEDDRQFSEAANKALTELEYDNAVVVTGPLEAGYAKEAPYDAIIVNGAIEVMPETILSQLRVGGRLVAIVGNGNAALATVWVNDDGHISSRPIFNYAVPPLPGFARKREFVF